MLFKPGPDPGRLKMTRRLPKRVRLTWNWSGRCLLQWRSYPSTAQRTVKENVLHASWKVILVISKDNQRKYLLILWSSYYSETVNEQIPRP